MREWGDPFFFFFLFSCILFLIFFFLFRCLVQQLRMFVPPLWPLSFSFLFSFLCCFVRACNSKKLLHCATHDTTFSLLLYHLLPPPCVMPLAIHLFFSSSGTTFFFPSLSLSIPFYFFHFFTSSFSFSSSSSSTFRISAQYSQAAKWQHASVPGEQSITTDPAGLRPHTFTQFRFQHKFRLPHHHSSEHLNFVFFKFFSFRKESTQIESHWNHKQKNEKKRCCGRIASFVDAVVNRI